jgi:hypothetical protein
LLLASAKVLAAGAGSYLLTGSPATLTYVALAAQTTIHMRGFMVNIGTLMDTK